MQENLDVVRHELRRAKAGWGPSVDAVGRTGASRLSNTTTRPLNADKDMYGANSISLTLTQPLWDGFATRSRVRTGEATVDSMTYRVLDNATSSPWTPSLPMWTCSAAARSCSLPRIT